MNGKWGLYEATGKMVVSCLFDMIGSPYEPLFYEGMTLVMNEGKYGFINRKGGLTIPRIYDSYSKFKGITDWYKTKNGFSYLLKVSRAGKEGYVDKNGNEIIPCVYESAHKHLTDGFFLVRRDGKWGLVNEEGKLVIPCSYDGISAYRNGVAEASIHCYGKRVTDIYDMNGKKF